MYVAQDEGGDSVVEGAAEAANYKLKILALKQTRITVFSFG
jgi:hypothetical protein